MGRDMEGSWSSLARMQDRLVRLLGNSVDGRSVLVGGMLHRNPSEATSYWLQLGVSIGIATLGLVVGSSAVVIGAMLVAPLLGPIVSLAMGLATGSPFLVLRSGGRIALSVIITVGGAALITVMLPFHELNAEIAARVSPTVLDLVTASFCALAGVYASLRAGSDTATTAAGTAISISLVPPLCAGGYGLGIGAWQVARGAGLLFLTNLVAIVVVGSVLFVAAGFNRVDVVTLERDELAEAGRDARVSRALARRLAWLFESRAGPALRFMMPFLLLAAVYVPLRRALDEVAWQVRVRTAVQEALAHEPARVVQNRVRVERHEVEVVVVLLGKASDAEATRKRLDTKISRIAGVAPRIEVLAVPDATALAGLESTLLTPRLATVVIPPPPSATDALKSALGRVRSAVEAAWPNASAGEPLAIQVDSASETSLHIQVVHLGPALNPDGAEVLRRTLSAELDQNVTLGDVALPARPLTRAAGDLRLLAEIAAGVRVAAQVPGLRLCVVRPAEPRRGRSAAAEIALSRALESELARYASVTFVSGDAWEIRFVRGACGSEAASVSAADSGLR
jgi:uncharacterized hydrophobic protein (TIGR00271 family)